MCSLAQGILDAADFGNLTADVEVDELEAILELVLVHIVDGAEQFARVQPELAAVTA